MFFLKNKLDGLENELKKHNKKGLPPVLETVPTYSILPCSQPPLHYLPQQLRQTQPYTCF